MAIRVGFQGIHGKGEELMDLVTLDEAKVSGNISTLKRYWSPRNTKFQDWYEMLLLIDTLKSKGMETYVSNEPMTFFNMSHYLLTKGELSHTSPVENESALELDKRAKVHRGCDYMWKTIDRERKLGGEASFIDDLSFFLLVLGWYSVVERFDSDTGLLETKIWNPYDTYPQYANNRLQSCVHSYKMTEGEAKEKAGEKGWTYPGLVNLMGEVSVDDYFIKDSEGVWQNMILYNGKDVTGLIPRPEMQLLVAPVGGFPDKGSLIKGHSSASSMGGTSDWRKLTGRGIFEVNIHVSEHFNKWKSMITQILRDTAQPVTQEFSASPQATPEQLRERGALFHYSPGETGINRVPPAAIPIEIQANLLELRREYQKGSYNDAVYGMLEGQTGYALSLLASSSANQILYPYMDGKHFVVSESDRFWLSNLKSSHRVFQIKGQFSEKLSPPDIPEDVMIEVRSSVATPKDWMERGTIANMVDKHLDEATIITKIYELNDPQGIRRRRKLQQMLDHPMSQTLELISAWEAHAKYLELRGDAKQAMRFHRAAAALETQIGAPAPGQGSPAESSKIEAARAAGTPEERTRIAPEVAPPEATSGFTPAELRRSVGRGSLRRAG